MDARLAGREFVAGNRYTIADITAMVVVDFAGWLKLAVPGGLRQSAPLVCGGIGKAEREGLGGGSRCVRLHQHFCRDIQQRAQLPHHRKCQRPFAGQHLGNPPTASNGGLQISAREPLLFHHELDSGNRIRCRNGNVLCLVCLNQCHEDVHPVAICCSGLGIP